MTAAVDQTMERFDIPLPGVESAFVPSPDATLEDVAQLLGQCGVTDLLDLRVPANDIRLQRAARELEPAEITSPLVRFQTKILRLLAGQRTGDRVTETGEIQPLPRLVGLHATQLWLPRLLGADGLPAPGQANSIPDIALLPHPDYPVEPGVQPTLMTAYNLRAEGEGLGPWKCDGCFSVRDRSGAVMIRTRHWERATIAGLDEAGEPFQYELTDDAHIGPAQHEALHGKGTLHALIVDPRNIFVRILDWPGDIVIARSMPATYDVRPPVLNLMRLGRTELGRMTGTDPFFYMLKDREKAYDEAKAAEKGQ